MHTKNKFLKRATALVCVCALTSAVLLSGCKDNEKKETPSEPKIEKTVNITDEKWKKLVEKPGTADENWTPAISAAIKYAAENGCEMVYAPAGRYPCEASDEKESWELEPAAFCLPDAPLTIKGDGESTVFYKPVAERKANSLAMFRTAFKGTAKITLRDFKVEGTYNPGPNYGLADAIVINGSSNVTVENIYTVGTKRHGIYLMCGAHDNVIKNVHIDNPTRMMLGTGIQLEGAYNNEFYGVYLTNIGANAIDLNMWNAGSFYPANDGTNGSPYEANEKYYSTGNVFIGGYISGTGLHNGNIGGGGYTDPSPHDDYYGINIINKSNNNKFELDYIENIRQTETNNENAAAIRLMASSNNSFKIGRVENSSQYVVRYNNPVWDNEITIDEVAGIKGELFNSSESDAARNKLVIGNQ